MKRRYDTGGVRGVEYGRPYNYLQYYTCEECSGVVCSVYSVYDG